ncbi:MAG: metallophosphoesterase [Methanomassiliicoccales archaeon]|jgi:Icc-related predicted phosphoesterase
MKVIATNDLHVHSNKWDLLYEAAKHINPDVIAVAGDLFPKFDGIRAELRFIPSLRKRAMKFKELGCQLVLILGNDDHQFLIKDMEHGHTEGLWHYVNESVVEIGGYEFAGLTYVTDYPFGYKFWCRKEEDGNLQIDPWQIGDPIIINEQGDFEKIPDYVAYLNKLPSIWQMLNETASKVKNIQKSIWLIHSPPSELLLDVCSDGRQVGSTAVRKFIADKQPLLTIHGHIHESAQKTGRWHNADSRTLCLQAGQIYNGLDYIVIDIDDTHIIAHHSVLPGELDWNGMDLYQDV